MRCILLIILGDFSVRMYFTLEAKKKNQSLLRDREVCIYAQNISA